MRSIKLRVTLQLDDEANAASMVFDHEARGRDLVTHPVENRSGDVVATITFAPDGRLVNLELLNAAEQLSSLMLHADPDESSDGGSH